MPKIIFSRTTNGDPDLSDLGAVKLHLRDPNREQLTVTREIRDTAEGQVIEAAKQMAFVSGRSFDESLKEVSRRQPELFTLARAPVDMGKFAVAAVRP